MNRTANFAMPNGWTRCARAAGATEMIVTIGITISPAMTFAHERSPHSAIHTTSSRKRAEQVATSTVLSSSTCRRVR